jgi:hypothetical protein
VSCYLALRRNLTERNRAFCRVVRESQSRGFLKLILIASELLAELNVGAFLIGDDVIPVHERHPLRRKGITGVDGAPFFPSQIMGPGMPLSMKQWPCEITGLITAVLDSPPLIEALIVRQPTLVFEQMPLALHRGRIDGIRE